MTMIEVLIASIILTAMVAMSSYLVWTSSKTVSSAETRIQAESQAREFLGTLTKELHQSKMATLRSVSWDNTLMVNYATTFRSPFPATPGTSNLIIPSANLGPPAVPGYQGVIKYLPTDIVPANRNKFLPNLNQFYAIRFRIPGKTLDLTTLNANHDTNAANFDLKAYKAGGLAANTNDYTYEIQYWWELQGDEATNTLGNAPNGLAPDGIDNNLNGVIDEGVIKKIETWSDTTGAILKRSQSTVCRDVHWDSVNLAPGLVFIVPGADATGTVYANGAANQLFVSVTIEKTDPVFPKDPLKHIVKTVTTFIDIRN